MRFKPVELGAELTVANSHLRRWRGEGTTVLDHGIRRNVFRSGHGFDTIELGNEPPLSVDGEGGGIVNRRRISVQWFSGTVLTGLCGAALMGGAVFASLDAQTNFAAVAERMDSVIRLAGTEQRHATTRKSDRLPTASEPSVARHIIHISTTSRSGDREVVRVRPLVRISGSLSMSASERTANIPPFNPQRMLADFGTNPSANTDIVAEAAPDAEVSFVMRDLGAVLPRARIAGVLPMDEIMLRVREAANANGSYSVASLEPTSRLSYAPEGGGVDPFARFEARIVPENMTQLAKTAYQTTGGNGWSDRLITAKKGEGVLTILRELGALPEEARAIVAALGAHGRDGALKEGQRLRILLANVNGGQRTKPNRVIVLGDTNAEAAVALSDTGRYVAVDVQHINARTEVAAGETESSTGVRLYESIYETALRNQMPRQVIDDLIRIYSYDVDYQRKVQSSDSFEVLFAGEDQTAGSDGRADVLYASLTTDGELKKFYRFQTPDDGVIDYYDETGKSAKKFLVRKPLATGEMRSNFGMRRHPILGYSKMHTGVDWAAPTGTQIFSAGNGVVERVGWEGGYGKYVRIRHANGYVTAYGHMTAFARGIEPGVRVRQGQVIGFVGSTGLSTGAHLHYEILVNGRFVDPMRIRLPRGRVLEGTMLATFERERDRVDAMLTRTPAPRLAQTSR